MKNAYQGKREDGTWEQFEWDGANAPTAEETGYTEVEVIGGEIEFSTPLTPAQEKMDFLSNSIAAMDIRNIIRVHMKGTPVTQREIIVGEILEVIAYKL